MFSELALLPLGIHIGLTALLGLLVGSFLNVVIYRQPLRLKHQWTAQSYEWLAISPDAPIEEPDSIVFPASRCQQCATSLKAWQNIPILSYLLLKGKCAKCSASISLRYPLVELLTAILSATVMWRFGFTYEAFFALLLTWTLVTLAFIDFDHQLLPDDIVMPCLWLGISLSLFSFFTKLEDSVVGAISGYLSLWFVFQSFKLLTGKEGMGFGDFKLLALLGAWLGWPFLPQIILISTTIGSTVGITLIVLKKVRKNTAIPFGPYLALAGWIALIWGEQINQTYLQTFQL